MIVAPRLLIATSNEGKVREFRKIIAEDVEIVTLSELGLTSPEEIGTTFAENADLKACSASSATGLVTLGDDSGLEIEALDGAPGILSARFAGEPVSDERNVAKVLAELQKRPAASRIARFRCVVSIAAHGEILHRGEGVCEGTIAGHPRGSNGFGYDPIFILPDGRTMAELSADEKNSVSHRSRAISSIETYLGSIMNTLRIDNQ